MATDRQTIKRIIVEHTEVSMITTRMEYLVPDPLSIGRTHRNWNSQPSRLPLTFQNVNSLNNPDLLSQNALHPSGINGICRELDTSLLNTMSHFGPTPSNLDIPHPPVHYFLNTNQSVSEPPAHNGANIQRSFATNQSPSYATSYSNVNLQGGTAYSNLLEPQATLPTGDFDSHGTKNMGGFTIMEENLDCGYSPYPTLPHQQPLNTANNSNLFSTMDAESYNGPLCPFPKIESQDLASSGTSAALNMLDEQRPMSNMPAFYGSEATTASTGSETFIPPYSATNASVSSGWEHVGIHAPQEIFHEKCLPSEIISCKSQTGPSVSPTHSCAASLYLPKIEESEDTGPLMDNAMQLASETNDYNDLDDSPPRQHLVPGVRNFNTSNLSDDLPIRHTINDHVKQEDLDSSSASMHSPNNVNSSTSDNWEISTHADAPVNADSDTSVENDITRSIKADFDSLFSQWTTAGDYGPNCSSTHDTGDMNAANQYNGNNTVISEPNGSQHSKGQVIRDAHSEETQPPRRKYRPRKKANPSEETQPKRKYRPRKKTNALPAEVGHSQETEGHEVHEYPSSTDRRKDPEERYFCLDRNCYGSGVTGYRGFPTPSDARRHINETGRHTRIKKYHCPLHHAKGAQDRRFPRPDGLRAHIRTMHKDIDVDSPPIREMIQAQKDARKSTAVEPEHGVNCIVVSMR